MQLRYLSILIMLIVLVSCSENSEPITANNKLITNVIKDSTVKADYQEGKTLFITNCRACHALQHANPQLLANLDRRWKDKKLLYEFVRNPQAVIAKDAYAKALYNECNKAEMTAFTSMTDKQIELILKYVEEGTKQNK